MRSASYVTGPDRAEALTALYARIAAATDEGARVPCLDEDGGLWLSDDPAEQEAAAWQCLQCPVINACGEYIGRHDELAGVWAGRAPALRKPARRRKERHDGDRSAT